jgi:putative aldouronate transport system permease protein
VDGILYVILTLIGIATVFPLYYVVVMSVTPLEEVIRQGGFVMVPSQISFEAYEHIFSSKRIPRAFLVTVFITVTGTALNLLFTTMLAYPLAKKFIPGRNVVLFMVVFTMLFTGGMIPLYILVSSLHLIDTYWALLLPGLISAFNLLVMKTYFEGLPGELEEAAKVDGCGDIRTLASIILPLSMPIMATLGLFYGVQHWNGYFHAIMFINDKEMMPIQVVLRRMIEAANVSSELEAANPVQIQELPPATIKMAAIVVAIAPIIMIYPFLQKHFIKGFLLGSIKG